MIDEIGRALRARSDDRDLIGAMELVSRLVEQSKTTSLRAYREAGGTED